MRCSPESTCCVSCLMPKIVAFGYRIPLCPVLGCLLLLCRFLWNRLCRPPQGDLSNGKTGRASPPFTRINPHRVIRLRRRGPRDDRAQLCPLAHPARNSFRRIPAIFHRQRLDHARHLSVCVPSRPTPQTTRPEGRAHARRLPTACGSGLFRMSASACQVIGLG